MTLRDATRRKHAEDAVAHLTTVFDALPDAACTLSPDGILLYVNQAAKVLFGIDDSDDNPPRHIGEFFDGRNRDTLLQQAIPEANQRGVWRGEMECVGKDGKRTQVSQVILAHTVYEEEPVFLSMSLRDVSRTRRMQEDLNLLAAALAEAVDGIAFLDGRGRYVFVNDAYAEMVGAGRETLGQTDWWRNIHPNDLEHMKYAYRAMQEVGKAKAEARCTSRNGTGKHIEFVMSRAQDGGNGYSGCYFFAKDITERKEAERKLADRAEELARSNAELEQFAYIASHDLQEPLRMVTSYTQLIAQRYKGRLDEDADEFIRFAVEGVTRMQALIRDLLDYSRVGRKGKGFRPVRFREVFETAVANLGKAIREAGAGVVCHADPVVLADSGQLAQLMQNLIGNAIKFRGSEPPEVRVEVKADAGMWLFSVIDNGIGIDPEYLDRIFEIFQRLHTREEYPGTGIGLAISRKIVERHGGRIWAEQGNGGGTVFRFTLPGVPEGEDEQQDG
jgi:PAS domain S-box-containing protein